jgi:hypothetical protein
MTSRKNRHPAFCLYKKSNQAAMHAQQRPGFQSRSAEDLIRNPGKQEKRPTRILLMGPRIPGFQIRKFPGQKGFLIS